MRVRVLVLCLVLLAGLCGWGVRDVAHHGVVGVKGTRVLYDQFHVQRHFIGARNVRGAWKYHEVSGYYQFRKALETAGYDVHVHREGPLTRDLLDGFDVVFVGEQTAQGTWMTDPERDALLDFVADGGGLWTVVEHTDAHGMATHWNRWVGDLPVQARYDSICEPNGTTDSRDWVAIRDFAEHPVTEGLEEVDFYNGCSLVTPHGVAFSSAESWSDRWDPTDPPIHNGDNLRGPDERAGPLTALAALDHGDGRVVAACDHNAFANPTLFMGSHVRLLHNAMGWLGGQRLHPLLPWTVLAGAGLVGLVGLCRRRRVVGWAGLAACVLVGGVAGAALGQRAAHDATQRDLLWTSSQAPDARARSKDPGDFFTLYEHALKAPELNAWVQPLGPGDWDGVVLAAPTELFDAQALQVLDDALAQGHTVAWLATVGSIRSAAGAQLQQRWGITVDLAPRPGAVSGSFQPTGLDILTDRVDHVYVPFNAPTVRLEGGQVALRLESGGEGMDFVAWKPVGPGRFVVVAPADLLSNQLLRRKATRLAAVDLIGNTFRWIAD